MNKTVKKYKRADQIELPSELVTNLEDHYIETTSDAYSEEIVEHKNIPATNFYLGNRIQIFTSKKQVKISLDDKEVIVLYGKNIYRTQKYIIPALSSDHEFISNVIEGREDVFVKLWQDVSLVSPTNTTIKEVVSAFVDLIGDIVYDYCKKKYFHSITENKKAESKYVSIKFDEKDNVNLHYISIMQKIFFPLYYMNKFRDGTEHVVTYICEKYPEVYCSIEKIKQLINTRVDMLSSSSDRSSLFKWYEVTYSTSREIIKLKCFKEIVNVTILSAFNVNSMPAYLISILDKYLYVMMLVASDESINYFGSMPSNLSSKNMRKKIDSIAFDTLVMKNVVPFNKYILDNNYITVEEIKLIRDLYDKTYHVLKYIIVPYITRCNFMYHQFTLSTKQIDVAIFLYILIKNHRNIESLSKLFISERVEGYNRITNDIIINAKQNIHTNSEINQLFIRNNIKNFISECSGKYINRLNETTFEVHPNFLVQEYLNYINKIIYSPGLVKLSFGYLVIQNNSMFK